MASDAEQIGVARQTGVSPVGENSTSRDDQPAREVADLMVQYSSADGMWFVVDLEGKERKGPFFNAIEGRNWITARKKRLISCGLRERLRS